MERARTSVRTAALEQRSLFAVKSKGDWGHTHSRERRYSSRERDALFVQKRTAKDGKVTVGWGTHQGRHRGARRTACPYASVGLDLETGDLNFETESRTVILGVLEPTYTTSQVGVGRVGRVRSGRGAGTRTGRDALKESPTLDESPLSLSLL